MRLPDGSGLEGTGRGRPRAEMGSVAAFVDAIPEGPGVLLLEGEAGIGKTTLWTAGVALAEKAGFQVATARVAQAETALSFAALGDLFHGVPDRVLDALPSPQRRALEVALLRRDAKGTVHEPRAVALACASALRLLTAEGPLLLAIDDIQWLDLPSARAIAFVLRRLRDERVGVLLSRRRGDDLRDPLFLDQTVTPDRIRNVAVGPLSAERLGALLRERLDSPLPHPLVLRIHAMATGNPFYALEIAREVVRRGVPEPGEPLPVPADAVDIVQRRLGSLPEATIATLRVVAAASRPTTDVVRRAMADGVAAPTHDIDAALAVAQQAGLVTVQRGLIRFTHPLFASGVTATIPDQERRAIHRRVAAAVGDPEQRARHLALAGLGPDAATAAALEHAAQSARGRGAASAAFELAALALDHTPADDAAGRLRRSVMAAMFAFESGDAPHAHAVLQEAIATTAPGPERAMIMNRLCEIYWQDTEQVERFSLLALDEVEDDVVAAAGARVSLAWTGVYRGDLAAATRHASTAWQLVCDHPDPAVRSDVLTARALAAFLTGQPFEALMDEAVRLQELLESREPTLTEVVYSAARVVRGLVALWSGDLTGARRHLEAELQKYEEQGRYVARDELLCYLAHVTCRSGDWATADSYVNECLEIGEESGHLRGRGQNIVPRAWLAALRGDLERARADAGEGLTLSRRYRDHLSAAANRGVLGFVELSAGDPAAAVNHLRPVVLFLRGSGTVEPGMLPFVADAVEALAVTGHLAEAQEIQDDDRLMGRVTDRPGTAALSARTAALLHAAHGDLPGAVRLLEVASDATDLQPFERARTLLLRGEVERRAKRKAQAREALMGAVAEFERLGAPLWAARARGELARVSSATAGAGLSPTEARLAELVVAGKTNREAAGLLFLSVKTVEANLSRIYRKLGVRSRAELVRLLVGQEQEHPRTAEVLPIARVAPPGERGSRGRTKGFP